MRARAVIGANFGDEGKGLVTDYLCSTQGAGMVVRFNGGAQAGHTVVTPDGRRHVFSHFGSGSFCDVPTFLSQFFICNPILFFDELRRLHELGVKPTVYAHPNCLITTFADMIINQEIENNRGSKRHGSCGLGFNETIMRSDIPELKITMSDLWNAAPLKDKLGEICGKYAQFRCGKEVEKPEAMIAQCPDPIFEGAQGLLLDEGNKQFFPHVTRSHTGMHNVKVLCEHAGIKDIETYYVSRTYLTRHGAGPLPGENPKMVFADDTNLEHPYQGTIRFAPLDMDGLRNRCATDSGGRFSLVLTHCDQLAEQCDADVYFDGPTREHARLDRKLRLVS
jgi:adenylosuccinate synthase